MSLLNNQEAANKKKRTLWVTVGLASTIVIIMLAYIGQKIPTATSIDFTSIRQNLSTKRIKSKGSVRGEGLGNGYSQSEDEKKFSAKRSAFVNQARARIYVEDAQMDYFQRNYPEARRRIDRAKEYDPSNFLAVRLSAQIYLDLRKYKKAYDDLERAKQIPNEDETISRDLDILRKLIRYTRSEIDRLQRYVYKHPNDEIAAARLVELYDQMED